MDFFGHSVAAGDFDKDGADDLVIGSWGEDFGSIEDAGAVNLIFGLTGSGLTESNNQIWH